MNPDARTRKEHDLDRALEIDDDVKQGAQLGPDGAGQSGDTQGLSSEPAASDESVEELTDEGQDIEAEVVQGVEDAGDHPEQPVPDRRDRR